MLNFKKSGIAKAVYVLTLKKNDKVAVLFSSGNLKHCIKLAEIAVTRLPINQKSLPYNYWQIYHQMVRHNNDNFNILDTEGYIMTISVTYLSAYEIEALEKNIEELSY